MRHVFLFATVAICASAACTKVESSSIKTAGMSTLMSVSADGTGKTIASVQLLVDNNGTDHIDLSTGDSLSAKTGSQSQSMSRSNFLNIVSYDAEFHGQDSGGTEYTIALARNADVSAPNSKVTLPAPFTIQTPTASATLSRATDDVVVTYGGGTSDKTSWQASGDCIKSLGPQDLPGDPGTFTIAKGTITPLDASKATATCLVSIAISRTRAGQVDPAYGHGGTITAAQSRSITINSKP